MSSSLSDSYLNCSISGQLYMRMIVDLLQFQKVVFEGSYECESCGCELMTFFELVTKIVRGQVT